MDRGVDEVGSAVSEGLAELRRHEESAAWLTALDAAPDPPVEMALPAAADLPAALRDLGVTDEDIRDLLETVPRPEASPELWRLVRRCAWSIVGPMGTVGEWPPLPRWPATTGAIGRGFYVWVFLVAAPFTRAFHRERGIPDEVSQATLADLGRNVRWGRRQTGTAAVADPWWLALHLRGAIYELGRLQFERATVGTRLSAALAAAGVVVERGDPALSVHIPAYAGPLDEAASDAAFERAAEFFARHFSEERYEIAFCYSWMLDEELAEYLPQSSNIIRFGHRFHPAYRFEPNDDTILGFVFGRADLPLDTYPQETMLERAVIAHLEAGRHWHGGAGWLRLP